MPDLFPSNPPRDLMQDLIDFHEKFGLNYDGPPRLLSLVLEKFRSEVMQEELLEYEDDTTIALKLDALIDLIYFALGTVYLHGCAPIFYEAWRRVHAANMTKMRSPASEESARRGCAFDVIKPPGFVPPQLDDLIERTHHAPSLDLRVPEADRRTDRKDEHPESSGQDVRPHAGDAPA